KLVDDFYEITITCNREGELAKRKRGIDEQLVLILPEEANDKGLAMTSSYSTMMLTALYLFSKNKDTFAQKVQEVAHAGEEMIAACKNVIPQLVKLPIHKLVYLGSGVFEGLSRESALKFLELTSGKYPTMFDTTLGFRHGPKSILDKGTMVVVYVSNHEYTRKYDLDMLKELFTEQERGPLVAISGLEDPEVEKYSDHQINVPLSKEEDILLAFPYIIFAQTLAYEKS